MFVKLSQGKVKIDRELEARLYRGTWEQTSRRWATPSTRPLTSRDRGTPAGTTHHLGDGLLDRLRALRRLAMGRPSLDQPREPGPVDPRHRGRPAGARAGQGPDAGRPASATPWCSVCGSTPASTPPRSRARFATDLPSAVDGLFRDLAAEGLLETAGPIVRLTGEGRMRADAVGVAILERFD
jgi:hypothetical protein